MGRPWRPGFWHTTKESRLNYHFRNAKSESIYISFPTYAELKRKIGEYLKENVYKQITVTRHRRGEWGEWFERWELVGDKPTITKQGWI